MKESTRAIFKKHGWRIDRAIHNIIYFRFYYPYIKILTTCVQALDHALWLKPILVPVGNFIFHRYHSKVLAREDFTKIFTLNEDLTLISEQNKQIIPFKYAHKIIFQDPENIAVMDCPCKKSTHAPQEDLNSCFMVGRGAAFWLEHCQKYNARKVSQQEALEIIERFRKKNYVIQSFFKVATGGCTGVICTCHPDHCLSLIGTRLKDKLGDGLIPVSAPSGYSVKHDITRCKLCGTCAKICHFGAIEIRDGKRSYNPIKCRGCDLCVENCSQAALALYIDPNKPLPLDLDLVKKRIAAQ